MNELNEWYENITYEQAKNILQENMDTLKMSFIAAGYYLKYIRDHELYLEDGYQSIWEFAEENYGIKKSTASRWMAMNDKFSRGGNSPVLAAEYRGFEKSQLQEMLYLDDKQIQAVTPDMTVKEIREVRKPEKSAEEDQTESIEVVATSQPDSTEEYSPEIRMHNPELPPGICMHDPQYPCSLTEKEMLTPGRGIGNCAGVCCWDCPAGKECVLRCRASEKRNREVAMSQQEEPESDQAPDQDSGYGLNQDADMIIDAEIVEDDGGMKDGKYLELSDKTDLQILHDLLDGAKEMLSAIRELYADEDIRTRKHRLMVAAYAGMIADLDVDDLPKHTQPDLPDLKNNDQRKEWLRNYESWGLWYEDKNIGARYYKYDFENGARLIAEEYTRPATEWYGEHITSYLHLVGGPEPPKKDCISKWQRHEVYDRFPNSETELIEFLKYVQKEGKASADRRNF